MHVTECSYCNLLMDKCNQQLSHGSGLQLPAVTFLSLISVTLRSSESGAHLDPLRLHSLSPSLPVCLFSSSLCLALAFIICFFFFFSPALSSLLWPGGHSLF